MALNGSIKEFGLTEIFQLIAHQQKGGVLRLARGKEQIAVCFERGRILRADAGNPNESFGKKLVQADILSEDQLMIARYRQERTQKSFETTLVELSFVSAQEIRRLIRLFTEETVYRLFYWKSGDYAFEQKDVPYNPTLIAPLDTQFILMEAIRQMDEWPGLLKKIPSEKTIFEKTAVEETAEEETGEETFGEEELSFASLDLSDEAQNEETPETVWLFQQVDGKQTVQEIIDRARMGAFSVYQGLIGLLEAGKIQEKKAETNRGESDTGFLDVKIVIRRAVDASVILLTLSLFLFAYPSLQAVSLKAARSFQAVQNLSDNNARYLIRYALDLYYLRHNRYPDSLQVLIDEGFFDAADDFSNRLKKWSYRREGKNSERFLLKKIQ